MTTTFLHLGSNLGNKRAFLESALINIQRCIGEIVTLSGIYETEPWGFSSTSSFFNQAVEIKTKHTPEKLIEIIFTIEEIAGRSRNQKSYTNRTLDIDILFYGNEIIESEQIKIPHPRLHLRKFVLIPLREIAPELVHPLFDKTVTELLYECRDESRVLRIEPAQKSNRQ
jgi:2-amino-4-hydroxy-6-hydroxymethyldihydropteridine diphosphokinase